MPAGEGGQRPVGRVIYRAIIRPALVAGPGRSVVQVRVNADRVAKRILDCQTNQPLGNARGERSGDRRANNEPDIPLLGLLIAEVVTQAPFAEQLATGVEIAERRMLAAAATAIGSGGQKLCFGDPPYAPGRELRKRIRDDAVLPCHRACSPLSESPGGSPLSSW